MYSILIVDDEYWVRKRLISTIEWKEIGIDKIYEAQDGREALELWQDEKPDIIVTDINMPELTGLELMEELNLIEGKPRIILISGYNEFEYARTALKFGAVDYLLKPVDENELIRVIRNCISEFEDEKKKQDEINSIEKTSVRFKEKIISDLLTGRIHSPENALFRLKQIGIDYNYKSAICVIAHLSTLNTAEGADYLDDTLAMISITELMNSVVPELFRHFFIMQIDQSSVAVLLSDETGDELQQKVAKVCEEVKKRIGKLFNTQVVFGIGSEVASLLELNQSYRTARYAFYSNNYDDWNKVLKYEKQNIKEWVNLQNIYSDYNINALNADIRNGNRDSALANLQLIIEEFLSGSELNVNPLQSKLFYINMMNTLIKNLVVGPASDKSLNMFMESLDDLDTFFTPERLKINLEKIVDFLITQHETLSGSKKHWVIGNVLDYIKKNYAKQITMKDVANKFFLNPSYFCTLFKDETGYNFTHYLTRTRIEKAKELLAQSSKKLYDIAAEVGYTNVQYFSTIFKEVEGITPSQFRAEYHRNIPSAD